MGIAPGGRVLREMAVGEMLTEANFQPDTTTFVYKLRAMQDAMLCQER